MTKAETIDYRELDIILKTSEIHGIYSTTDYEVSDLQETLAIAWELLNEKTRKVLVKRFFDEVADRYPCYKRQQPNNTGNRLGVAR